MENTPLWLLLDERAKFGDVDGALCNLTADSEDEARELGIELLRDDDPHASGIWVDPDGELRWDIPPCSP